MKVIKSIFLKDPESPWFWLTLALIVKGIFPFIWLFHSPPPNDVPGFWGGIGGDTSSYIDPIDNFLKFGMYIPDFRMPGYGAVYLIFRLFVSKPAALNCLLILQYLLASLSVYIVSLTAKRIFESNTVFYFCF